LNISHLLCPSPEVSPTLHISPATFGQSTQTGEAEMCVCEYSSEFAAGYLISSVFQRQRQQLQAPPEFLPAQEHRGRLNSRVLCEAAEGRCVTVPQSLQELSGHESCCLFAETSQRHLECICL